MLSWDHSLKSSLSSTGIGLFLQNTARPLPPSCRARKETRETIIYSNYMWKQEEWNCKSDRGHTAIQTTLTAEGTATSGLVKCFWASRNPSAELCQIKQVHETSSFSKSHQIIKNTQTSSRKKPIGNKFNRSTLHSDVSVPRYGNLLSSIDCKWHYIFT